MTDLWMEAAMEDRNATLSFPGHHEVWTDQFAPPLSAISLLPAAEEFSEKRKVQVAMKTLTTGQSAENESLWNAQL